MLAILDYCSKGSRREIPAGIEFIHEGSKTGHLFVLVEGRSRSSGVTASSP